MQIAVLSDIHGNHIALKTCVAYALSRGIDTFLFLGDYLGELAYPEKTMDFLYDMKEKYRCIFLRGNKEDYWIGHEKCGEQGWKEVDSTTGAMFYVYQHLRPADMEFFKSLTHREEVHFGDELPALTVCHGSPFKSNEKMLPDSARTFEIMESDPNDLILCGHTHVQGAITHGGKTVLNAGSVGLPSGSSGKAQFLILKDGERHWKYDFLSLEYDVERVIEELLVSGLYLKAPCWSKVTVQALRKGEISHGTVLARAMEICREENGVCQWPQIPERCWERAVEEFFPQQVQESWKLLASLTDKVVLGLDGLSDKPPRITARAILQNSDGLYAVMYSKKFDLYTLPGGGVETGETLEETLRREILEETGCTCDRIWPLGYVAENRYHADYTVNSFYFCVITSSKSKQLHLTEDELKSGTCLQWHSLQEVVHLIKDRKHETFQRNFLQARDMAALEAYIKRISECMDLSEPLKTR